MYTAWMIILRDYFKLLEKKEVKFEIVLPVVISIVLSIICSIKGLTMTCVDHMNDILINVMAILIGFLISAIAIFAASESLPKASDIFEEKANRIEQITYKQFLLTQFSYCLFMAVFMVLVVILFMFLTKAWPSSWIYVVALFIYIFELLHMMLLLIRSITWIYSMCWPERQP